MKISGFTMVRNGSRFDYPYLEAIASLLPLVDEMIVNVGKGEDDTLLQVQRLRDRDASRSQSGFSKIRIIESTWALGSSGALGGQVLAEQTNIAREACTGDWLIHLQADEIFHERDLEKIRFAMTRAWSDPAVEGLVFPYHHFYGSYDVVQQTRSAYRREVRAFKKASGAVSVGDAQSFRKLDGSKLRVDLVDAPVFHYGWVRPPEVMREKTFFMDQLYHGAPKDSDAQVRRPHSGENYRYKRIWGLQPFSGSHPAVMTKRIQENGWTWTWADFTRTPLTWSVSDLKKIVLDLVERFTGVRLFEYRSYELHKS